MKPDTTSTRTTALQNSLFGICDVFIGFCWPSGEGACSAGTEASLSEKDSCARGQSCGTWYKEAANVQTELLSAGGSMFMLRGRGEN